MRKIRLFSIAALALAMAACSSEENTLETQSPAAPGKLHFTATIATPDNGAGTRTEYSKQTDGTINVAWKENDEIAAVVTNSEGKYVKDVLKVSKVNTDGSAVISGDIAKPKDDALKVDLIYPASIVTIDDHGILCVSFDKMRNGITLDGTLESIANNIDYRRADGCALTVSGDKATLTSAAKLESKLSIWKLTLKKEDNSSLSATQVAIADGAGVMASATLTSAASEVYLPVRDVSGADICITATTSGGNYIYMKEGVTLAAKKYYQSTVQMMKGAHLALLTDDYEAKDGDILTGTLTSNVKISIADGATVTLKDVQINESGTCTSGDYAGITSGDNSIINLEGTNTVKGFADDYPGIYVPDGKTLTIQGTGSLTASSGVDSYGHLSGAGIGGGYKGTCGNINITSDVTKVTATKGEGANNSIGAGNNGTCGTVTIGGVEGAITTSPFEYSPIPATAHTLGASVVGDVVDTDGNAYTLDATHVLPSGVTAVAMVAYKSAAAGSSLAIALADEGAMNWSSAKSTCEGKTAIGGKSWKLPTQGEWKQMLSANGGNEGSYTGLNSAITTAGGTALKDLGVYYWSSTEGSAENSAWDLRLENGVAAWDLIPDNKEDSDNVRACLAF